MKTRDWKGFLGAVVGAVGLGVQALEVGGSLVVDLNMASLAGQAEGATIGTWANRATGADRVGDFVAVNAGQGGKFSTATGVPAVRFDGNAETAMWCPDALPATVVGGDSWTAEVWIYNPSLTQGIETYLSWTYRGSANKCMEMRYGTDNNNAIEHHSNNIGWGGVPSANNWHHIAITRDAVGNEVLYVDGAARVRKDNYTQLDLPAGGNFYLGGVKNTDAQGGFDGNMFFSGYLATVRVHTDGLTAEQVRANYLAEMAAFQDVWAGADGLWTEAANWSGGRVPSHAATFPNGGVATVTGDVTLDDLVLHRGGVAVDGGSFTYKGSGDLRLNNGDEDTTFAVRAGSFVSEASCRGVAGGGEATITFGAPGQPEESVRVTFKREFTGAQPGRAAVTIEDGAAVTVSAWFRGAYGGGASSEIVQNGGSVTCNDWFLLATDGGSARLTINGGHFLCPGFEFTYAGNSESQYGDLVLNGGVLEMSRFQNANMAGRQTITFNGGTIKARGTSGNFLENRFDKVSVQAGGAFFDVPNNFAIDVRNAFTAEGGTIVKRNTGRLNFDEAFSFAGPIDVQAGSVKFVKRANLAAVTSLAVAPDAAVMCTEAGGVNDIVSRLPADSAATVLITAENANDNIDLTGHPNVKLGYSSAFAFTGSITYDPAAKPTYAFVQYQGVVDVTNALVDQNGIPTALMVTGAPGPNFKLVLKADNTFTGGITVEGGMLQSDAAQGFGTTGAIRLLDADLVLNNADIDVQGLIDRLTPDSVGSLIFCNNSRKDVSFSLVGHPGIYIASYLGHNFDYTGRITWDGPECRFGGGYAPYNNSDGNFRYNPAGGIADLADGTPVTLVGGRPGAFSVIAPSSFTGGVIVTNDAVLNIRNNAAAFGTVPATARPDYFFFDGGHVRGGGQSTVLAANQGVTIGPKGMKGHMWSDASHIFLGSVHGTGPMTFTDSGRVGFGGVDNDYAGEVTVNESCQFQIGSDLGFSWDFDHALPKLNATARLVLYIRDGETYDFAHALAQGRLAKEGPGLLTVSVPQNTSGTIVSDGTLAVAADGLVKGDLTVEGTGVFEIRDGATVTVNALNGTGLISAPEGTTARLQFSGGSFAGTVAPNVTLVKIGAGRAEVALAGTVETLDVLEGTLAVQADTLVRPVVAAGARLELVQGGPGLLGKYYGGVDALEDWKNIIGDLARMDALEASREAEAVQACDAWGAEFVAHGQNDRYPGGFGGRDYWIAIWRGRFWAKTAGVYGFATASDDGSSVFIDGQLVVRNILDQGWGDGQFNTTYREVELTRGWHDMVIGFYENTGGNDIGVKMAPPDGELAMLPIAQLFHGNGGETTILDQSGIAGSLVLGDGLPRVTFDVAAGETQDLTGSFAVNPTRGEIVKKGEGTLVYAAAGGAESTPVSFAVEAGTVVLKEATAVGDLAVADGATVAVAETRNANYRGLSLGYYDTNDNSYSHFQTYEALHAFYEGTAASLLTDTWTAFRWNKLSASSGDGVNGLRFTDKYILADNFETYMTGSIYLPYTGQYAFGVQSDDGVALYIDGVRRYFYNGVTAGPDQANSGWINLTAGFHKFEFAFRENGGNQYVDAYIKARGADGNETFARFADWELIPQDLLFPEISCATALTGTGTLDLGAGELWIDSQSAGEFAGVLTGETGAYLVKGGIDTLALTGDLSGFTGTLVAAGGELCVKTGVAGRAFRTPEDRVIPAGVVVEPGATFTVDTAGGVVFAGDLSGAGTVVVRGGARLTMGVGRGFTGRVIVEDGEFLAAGDACGAQGYTVLTREAGTARVAEGRAEFALGAATTHTPFDAKYFRLSLKETHDNTIVQLSEFSLYAKDGTRQNLNLARQADGLAATSLAPGQFTAGAGYGYGNNEGPDRLFDGNTGTKACFAGPNLDDPSDAAKWRVVTLRLAANAAPITTYSFTTANDCTPARNPVSWMLEASDNGVDWTVIDEKTDWREGPTTIFTEFPHFTHALSDGFVFPAGNSITTEAGAEAVIHGSADVALAGGAVTVTGLAAYPAADDAANWTFSRQAQPIADEKGGKGLWLLYGETSSAAAAFLTSRVNVDRPWRVTFTYFAQQGFSQPEWADGIAFCIQNEAAGAAFCDNTKLGGELAGAVAGEHPSCATFWFNLYQKENCGWALGGQKYETDAGYLCRREDRFSAVGYDVEISYDGVRLVSRVWHAGELLATLPQAVDLRAVVGRGDPAWDGTAYLGFTGATGGANARMYVRNLHVYLTPEATPEMGSTVAVAESGTLKAFADDTVLDTLALAAGARLTVAADPSMKAVDLDYTVAVNTLQAAVGDGTIYLDNNGAGVGTLRIGELRADGGKVTVVGGRLASADGTIKIVIPDSTPNGFINLLQFNQSEWMGDLPRLQIVGDTDEATKYKYYRAYQSGPRIFVSNGFATTLFFR